MVTLGRLRRGFKKARCGNKRVKQPLTMDVLSKMLVHLDVNNYNHTVLRSLLLFAKFGVLRVSEYSYGTRGNAPSVGNLRIISLFYNLWFCSHSEKKFPCKNNTRNCNQKRDNNPGKNSLNSRP